MRLDVRSVLLRVFLDVNGLRPGFTARPLPLAASGDATEKATNAHNSSHSHGRRVVTGFLRGNSILLDGEQLFSGVCRRVASETFEILTAGQRALP